MKVASSEGFDNGRLGASGDRYRARLICTTLLMSPVMRRMVHALRLLSIMVIALVIAAGVIRWASRPSVRSVERQIEKEIPPGSSRAKVLSFLVARQIEHSEILTDPNREADLSDGLRLNNRFITAVIHNRYLLFPAEERIVVNFYFAEDDSLVDHDTRAHQIAP